MTDTTIEHVNVVQGPRGEFTERFDDRTVETLVRLGLIEHKRDDHVVQVGTPDGWRDSGPVHRFYGPPERP